VTLPMLILLVH